MNVNLRKGISQPLDLLVVGHPKADVFFHRLRNEDLPLFSIFTNDQVKGWVFLPPSTPTARPAAGSFPVEKGSMHQRPGADELIQLGAKGSFPSSHFGPRYVA